MIQTDTNYMLPYRPRRLRKNVFLRNLVKETELNIKNFIYPIFIVEGENVEQEIQSLPGLYRYSKDKVAEEVKRAVQDGIQGVLLFGIPDKKDEMASSAYDENGVVQQAVKAIKNAVPDILVITDVCLCEYTNHGHCGIVKDGQVLNDESLSLIAKTALSQVQAGADMVAPSDMMDGRVGVIRETLDDAGYSDIPIMSYSAKYASALYNPFREAANNAPHFGDRLSYQLDPANAKEALREVELDMEEGADIIMIKPAIGYLDIIYRVKETFNCPVAAYSVSGEYAIVKAAVKQGLLDEKRTVLEFMTGIKRAGADIIITYYARQIAKWL